LRPRSPALAQLAGVLLVPALIWFAGCGREPAEPRNVLLLFIDTLRADRTSVHGHLERTTPELEAFAATATTFERAYSTSSWTRASFASYFTGLYPSVHGCEDEQGYLDHGLSTLAELFQARGYRTVGIFANQNVGPAWGFAQGFDLYEHPEPNAGYPGDVLVTDAAAVNERVLRWLREERPDEPWFLFVLYIDPHDPYLQHPDHGAGPPPAPGVDGSRRFLDAFDDKDKDPEAMRVKMYVRSLYDGEVAHADRHAGVLLDALDEEGLTDETVVVISSDHGEGLWEHMSYRKHGRLVFEEQIHVPLIVRWPGRTEPGRRIARPVGVIDLFGALCEAYELAPPDAYQAGSLLDALAPDAPPRPVYAEQRLYDVDFRVVVEWPWKLIRDDAWDRSWAFDLATNPQEYRDDRLIAQQRARDLTRLADDFSARNDAFAKRLVFTHEREEIDEKTVRELRALGY
jgi:arylsulfatase A-like enzyme